MARTQEQLIEEITKRLRYYPADTEQKRRQYEIVRLLTWSYALELVQLIPDSRELSEALTNLENAQLWANKALAIYGANDDGALLRAGQETVAKVIDFLEYDRVPHELLGRSRESSPKGGTDAH